MDYIQPLLSGIKENPYWTITAVSFVESRYTSIAVGALAARGDIDPIISYVIFVIMCILGDILHYIAGRTGNNVGKLIVRKNWIKKLEQFTSEKTNQNLTSLLIFGKVVGISKPVIIASGVAKMPFPTFCYITVPCTVMLYAITIAIGYFFGHMIF